MIIYLNVKPGSKEERIEKISDSEYKIWLKEKAIDGKANIALVKILCKEFDVSYDKLKIKGLRSRKKTVYINE